MVSPAEASDAATRDGFGVEVAVFSGPFRLLAEMILERKIDVCDVKIAEVTDSFLALAGNMSATTSQPGADVPAPGWNLEEATWFLAICAVLLELKVGRLMPDRSEPDEDDILGVSPDLRYARSRELAAFRRVALELARRLEDEAAFFGRDAGPGPDLAHLYPDPLERVTLEQLAHEAAAMLRPPPTLDLFHVTPVRFTVADAMTTLETRIASIGPAATFRDLVADCEERMHVVVRFLAVLELYREGKVDLAQAETFGEIEVAWRG
jgi:segregation and condensation protein A